MFDWREGQSVAYLLYRQITVIDCRAGVLTTAVLRANIVVLAIDTKFDADYRLDCRGIYFGSARPTWPDFALEERANASTRQHCKLDFDPNLHMFTLALMAGLTTWGFIPID